MGRGVRFLRLGAFFFSSFFFFSLFSFSLVLVQRETREDAPLFCGRSQQQTGPPDFETPTTSGGGPPAQVIHELWTPVGGAYNVDGVLRARALRVDGRLGRGPWFRLPSAWTWMCLLAEQPRVRFLLRFSSWFPFQTVPKSLLPLLDFSINLRQTCPYEESLIFERSGKDQTGDLCEEMQGRSFGSVST